jgi:hypothetical protein
LAGLHPQQWSNVLAKILIPECALDEEQQQDVQETLHARIGEAERGCALLPDRHRLLQVLEHGFSDEAIVADTFNVKQTSVGCKANSTQLGKVFDGSADTKVTRIVDGRFGSKGFPLLVVLLDTGLLVIDMQRGDHALGNDPGPEPAWRTAVDLGSPG